MSAVYSMTGFGKSEIERDGLLVSVEVKSVNHRFKDIRFKMSSMLAPIELELRNMINSVFKRGSFEIFISYKRIETSSRFDDIDEAKVKSFLNKIKSMVDDSSTLAIRPTEFMRAEFMMDHDNSLNDLFCELTKEVFPAALEDLKKSREVEGAKLVTVLLDHRSSFVTEFEKVKIHGDTFQDVVTAKLIKRFEELKVSMPVDEPRFMQEVVFYLEKMDVHEEINRINTHLDKLRTLLESGGEVGRQIDFLIQELNRETNTTGSKSTVEVISQAIVQMKVHLEKIREQALNLE